MEKRGQVFLVAGIILALVLFSVSVVYNNYEEKILLEDFPDLSENYEREATKVVNEALLSGSNPAEVSTELDEFTSDYVDYARERDPNIGFVYVYWDRKEQNYIIRNYLKEGDPINFENNNGELDTIFPTTENALTDISIETGEFTFKKTIPVKLNNFDEDYSGTTTDLIKMEIGGIFYPVDALNPERLQILAKSSSGIEEARIEWTGLT